MDLGMLELMIGNKTIVLSQNDRVILKEILGRMNIEDLKNEVESKLVYRLYEAL